MNIPSSQFQRPALKRTGSSSDSQTFSSSEKSNTGKYIATGALATGGVGLGAAMLFPEKTADIFTSIGDTVAPVASVVMPVLSGLVVGGGAGMVTGGAFAMVATMGKTDSTPAYATIGGMMGGVVVGGVVGGVSAAFGATPLLAIPAVVVGGAAFMAMS